MQTRHEVLDWRGAFQLPAALPGPELRAWGGVRSSPAATSGRPASAGSLTRRRSSDGASGDLGAQWPGTAPRRSANPVRVCNEGASLAQSIHEKERNPDQGIVHQGDLRYPGTDCEVRNNCLRRSATLLLVRLGRGAPTLWPASSGAGRARPAPDPVTHHSAVRQGTGTSKLGMT